MKVKEIMIGSYLELGRFADTLLRNVFCSEQGIPDDEIFDNKHYSAVFIVSFDNSLPIAVAQLNRNISNWTIGWVAVKKEYRSQHFGERLMTTALGYIASHGGREIILMSQKQVQGFYKKLGFAQYGEPISLDSGFVLIPMRYLPTLILHIPSIDELEYRRFLIGDKDTMEYNLGFGDNGGGCYLTTLEQCKKWYKCWTDSGNFYAYVIRQLDNTPVGEVNIHFTDGFPKENAEGWIGIIIEAKHRKKGYAKNALKLLVNYAFYELKLTTLFDDIPCERDYTVHLYEKVGFFRNGDGVMEMKPVDKFNP